MAADNKVEICKGWTVEEGANFAKIVSLFTDLIVEDGKLLMVKKGNPFNIKNN